VDRRLGRVLELVVVLMNPQIGGHTRMPLQAVVDDLPGEIGECGIARAIRRSERPCSTRRTGNGDGQDECEEQPHGSGYLNRTPNRYLEVVDHLPD